MTITTVEERGDIKNTVGLFFCKDSVFDDDVFGVPAQIVRITGSRVYYQLLPRDREAEKSQIGVEDFVPQFKKDWSDEPEPDIGFCNGAKIIYVCDTAEEVIAMRQLSVQTANDIRKMRKQSLARVIAMVENGWLSPLDGAASPSP